MSRRFNSATVSNARVLQRAPVNQRASCISAVLAGAMALGLAACGEWTDEPPASGPGPRSARLKEKKEKERYIIVLKPGVVQPGHTVPDIANEKAKKHDGDVAQTYEHALEGFALDLPPGQVKKLEEDDDDVDYVEADAEAEAVYTDTNATWGLDRIDQRASTLDNTYTYPNLGEGVHVYVLDTGVYASHPELAGRVSGGIDYIDLDGDPTDCNGHGTHVAGTLGGTTVGVAKQVAIHPVRVLGCVAGASCPNPCITTAPWSTIIKGIDWVTANRISPAVANMSISGSYLQSVNDAVTRSIAAGVTYVVASGNNGADACAYSPAATPNAITVAASTAADRQAGYANVGACVDLYAPGDNIYSAVPPSGYQTQSGTSMAAPHVAGAAALYLAAHPDATPATVA